MASFGRLQNKVIDIEVANGTPSPTVDPSVHVILCGHSMGGIVAAETLLSVARDEPVAPTYANDTTNSTTRPSSSSKRATNLGVPERDERSSSAPPQEHPTLFFPCIQAIISFDTPYLGISPGVLAHGAEEHINRASSAYKAFDTASNFFGWNSPRSTTPEPIANAANKGLPPANSTNSGGWSKWGKYAAYGGAAAAIAGAAGAAYLNRDQIGQGFAWAGSHLEFVGCLARGAELQKRVEDVVQFTETHGVGFSNFYASLGEKITSQTKYAGSVLGADRTFCVVPKSSREPESPTGTKRDAPSSNPPPPKRRKTRSALNDEMDEGEQVQEYADDTRKSKGRWVKCVNDAAGDELRAHTSMFSPKRNPDYHSMAPRARDQIVEWINKSWYEGSADESQQQYGEEDTSAGADESMEANA